MGVFYIHVPRVFLKMKNLKLLLLLPCLLSFSGCAKQYKPKELDPNVTYANVYLIMGQSNASGNAKQSFLENNQPELYQKYLEGNSKVLITRDVDDQIDTNYVPTKFGFGNNSEMFGPEIGMAETLEQYEGKSYIIKATCGGSCLQAHYVNKLGTKQALYNRYIRFIKQQLKALEDMNFIPRVRGVFWMQGESDSFKEYASTYYEAEKYLLKYLRLDLNEWIYDHFNFVDAYISTKSLWPDPDSINKAKQKLADNNEHCYCFKTNGEDETAIDLTLKSISGEDPDDAAHYDSASMILLGKTAAQYLIK